MMQCSFRPNTTHRRSSDSRSPGTSFLGYGDLETSRVSLCLRHRIPMTYISRFPLVEGPSRAASPRGQRSVWCNYSLCVDMKLSMIGSSPMGRSPPHSRQVSPRGGPRGTTRRVNYCDGLKTNTPPFLSNPSAVSCR